MAGNSVYFELARAKRQAAHVANCKWRGVNWKGENLLREEEL
jgi:hypothetical protein